MITVAQSGGPNQANRQRNERGGGGWWCAAAYTAQKIILVFLCFT